jgi:hypothetical protein
MQVDDSSQAVKPKSAEGQAPLLRGHMGVFEIAFTVLAFSAPLTTAWGYLPFVILFGGIGAPLCFFVAMVLPRRGGGDARQGEILPRRPLYSRAIPAQLSTGPTR